MTETLQQTRERLKLEAMAWHLRLTSGTATEAMRAEFAVWRQQSPDHDHAYRELEQLWQQLPGPLRADRARRRGIAAKQRRTRMPWRNFGLAVAASLLLVAAVYPDYFSHPFSDYRTHIGEQISVSLADGSVVHLNTDTAINVSFNDNERRIELLGGEAEFDVAHDSGRPFRVTAGHATAEALGTRFIVRYDGAGGNVTLLQGQIRASQPWARGKKSAMLQAGQQIGFTADNLDVARFADMDIAQAWRRGRLLMNFVPLKQVIAEINRYRRGQIRLLDDRLGEQEVNIAIDIRQIDAWLEVLRNTLPVKVDKLGPLVLLRS